MSSDPDRGSEPGRPPEAGMPAPGRRLGVVVLAAGRGTRMKSALPKVFHPVCGQPMVAHVTAAARELVPVQIAVVVGHGAALVQEALAGSGVTFVTQAEQLGTAHAVGCSRAALAGCDDVMVLNGDSPLVGAGLLAALRAARGEAPMAFVTCTVADGARLGRVIRDASGSAIGIAEAPDDPDRPPAIEINAGQYVFDAGWLWRELETIERSPSGEYYLTALPARAHAQGTPAATVAGDPAEVLGVDDRERLAEAEALMRDRIRRRHMAAGVTVADPRTTYIDAAVVLAADTTLLPNCYLYGATEVATGAVIGPGTTLVNARIGRDTRVQSSVIEDSAIGERVRVGPFAHVRGGASIGDDCELGNYAEVKNSVLGRGVKMHHFSYVGDADVGEEANIAAGIITCNYDGVRKHRTTIGARAFVGCDTMLVAPVTVGEGAITGAGSVVTRDIPAGKKAMGVPARVVGDAAREGETDGS